MAFTVAFVWRVPIIVVISGIICDLRNRLQRHGLHSE